MPASVLLFALVCAGYGRRTKMTVGHNQSNVSQREVSDAVSEHHEGNSFEEHQNPQSLAALEQSQSVRFVPQAQGHSHFAAERHSNPVGKQNVLSVDGHVDRHHLAKPLSANGGDISMSIANDESGVAVLSPIRDFMTPVAKAVVLSPDMPLRDAAAKLLSAKRAGGPVVENGVLVGVLTQFDFLRKEADAQSLKLTEATYSSDVEKVLGQEVRSQMKSNPVVLTPDNTMQEAAALMLEKGFNHVPIVSSMTSKELVGWLSSSDVLRHALALDSVTSLIMGNLKG